LRDILDLVSDFFPGMIVHSLKFGDEDKTFIGRTYMEEVKDLKLSNVWDKLVSPKVKVISAIMQSLENVSVASSQGLRYSMEDEHILKRFIVSGKVVTIAGIFDGHGGSNCSLALRHYFEKDFTVTKDMLKDKTLLKKYMRTVNFYIEKRFRETGMFGREGSTCLYVVIVEFKNRSEIFISNVGDCRLLLLHDNKVVLETVDHKPSKLPERERILKTGGRVENMNGIRRVNGVLSVSRAHGCNAESFSLKFDGENNFSPYNCPVSCRPDIYTATVYSNVKDSVRIIMACDGLWDVISTRNIETLMSSIDGNICEKLIEESITRGSKDNITVMLIELTKIKMTQRKEV